MANFVAEFCAPEQSVVQSLTRVNTQYDRLFPLGEAQILSRVFPKLLMRCVRLAKHIFSNTWVSSRKDQNLVGHEISTYLEGHIVTVWRHLTQSLTNHAAERFNRKIEKCLSGRDGFSSTIRVEVLLRGLCLKELILNGRKHAAATSPIVELDLTEICQGSLNVDKILHNFDDYAVSRIEKLA